MDPSAFLPIIYSAKKNLADIELTSYNNLITEFPNVLRNEFKQKMSYTYPQPVADNIVRVEYGYKYVKVWFEKCYQMVNGRNVPIYPSDAQKSGRTYEVRIYVDIEYHVRFTRKINGNLIVDKKIKTQHNGKILGSMPCMIKSKLCHLHGLTPQDLIMIGEDPLDIGGYVRIGGSDKCNVAFKNNSKNFPQFHIVKNSKDGSKVKLKCDFTSKPGDNYEKSTYLVLCITSQNCIYFVLTLGKELVLYIPFFVIFYIFGITCDMAILKTIMPDMNEDSDIDRNIQKILSNALTMDYSSHKACGVKKEFISNYKFADLYDKQGRPIKNSSELLIKLAVNINENDGGAQSESYIVNSKDETQLNVTRDRIAYRLDQSILPHIGTNPDDRPEKLKFLGGMIKKSILTELGEIPQTDRNDYGQQVCNAIGPCIVQAAKAIINIACTNPFNKALTNSIQANPKVKFDDVFKNNHKPNAIGDNLDKALKAGNKDTLVINKSTEIRSRVVTVLKDIVNLISIIYSINGATPDPNGIAGKGGESEFESRKVKSSQQGLLCNVQAVEGEKAGQSGQFTLGCILTTIIDTKSIEELVRKDLQPTDLAYENRRYGIVYVNYKAIGSYHDNYALREKYVKLRRQGKIDRKTGIVYYPMEDNKLLFFTTQGRFVRPYLVVDNNYQERVKNKKIQFKQTIRYTMEHAFKLSSGEMELQDLEYEGIIEYISPEENRNIYCCDSYQTFLKNQNNPLSAYTHMCVPELEYCLNTLTAPFGNQSDTVRTTYQSKLCKQALSMPVGNYYNAFNAKFPISYHSFDPVVSTIADRMVQVGGANAIVQIKTCGTNQEDSMAIRQRTSQCGKFGANMFIQVSAELDNDQQLGLPTQGKTMNIRGTSYNHIGANGFPKLGTVVEKGMVVIGIIKSNADGTETDNSILHKKNIPMRVSGFSSDCNKNGAKVVKVKLSSARELKQGDKMAHRSGNKNIISQIKYDEDVAVCANGMIADMIFSPHSLPSRMTINVLLEGYEATRALSSGCRVDATMFRSVSAKYLEDPDINLGSSIMYNPMTGDRMQGEIYCVPLFYQRLTRMVMDNYNGVGTPIIDIRTGQANKGIANGGGLRLGEMEVNTIWANSAMAMLTEKMFKTGDGKEIVVCDICKQVAIVNPDPDKEIYECKTCDNPVFVEVSTCIATLAFFRGLEQLGICTEISPEMPMFEEYV